MSLAIHLALLVCLSCNKSSRNAKPADENTPAPSRPLKERFGSLRPLASVDVPTGSPGRGFAISPDGKELAIGGSDGSVMLVSTRDPGEKARILVGHTELVLEAAYTPDGKRILTGGADNKLIVWDRHTGTMEHKLSAHNGDVKALAVSPDGTLAATGSVDDDVRVWRLDDGKRTQHFDGHDSTVYAVLFSPNGQHVYSGARDSQIRRWSLEKGKGDANPLSFHNTVVALRFGPDDQTLIMAGLVGELVWIDAATFAVQHKRRVGRARIVDMDVSHDGIIAIGEKSGELSFWSSDPKVSEPLVRPFRAHQAEILRVLYLPRSSTLLTLCVDGTIGRWDSRTGKAAGPAGRLPPVNGMVRALAGNPKRPSAAVASRGTLFLVDAGGGDARAREVELGPGGVSAVAYLPDGRELFVGRDNGHVLVREPEVGGRTVRDAPVHGGTVRHMAFTADGKSLWTAGDDIALYHLDPATLERRLTVTDHTSPIIALAVDPTGERVASAEEDHITFIRYAKTNTIQWTRRGHNVECLAFDPTGEVLAMVEDRRHILLYDVEARRERKRLKGSPARVRDIVFHPDGEVIVTVDALGTVRAWSVEDGSNLASADAGRGRPTGLALGDGGTLLVSGGMDPFGSVKLLRFGPEK